MALTIDLFFSFRSPYSYLAMPQIAALIQRYDLEVRLRVVMPIAVRIPGFFQQVNPLWPPYLMRDTRRIAEMQETPFRWPNPDPIIQSFGEVASEQPRIWPVSRLGAAAERLGRGFAFAKAASFKIWSGSIDGWHEGPHLADAAREAGLDPQAVFALLESDSERLDADIAANEAAQKAAGHWGVPLFVFEGEPFFGQDRIDHLVWRLRQNGLRARGPAA